MSPRLALRRVRQAKQRRKDRERRVAVAKEGLKIAIRGQDIYWRSLSHWEPFNPEREATYAKRIEDATTALQRAYAS